MLPYIFHIKCRGGRGGGGRANTKDYVWNTILCVVYSLPACNLASVRLCR